MSKRLEEIKDEYAQSKGFNDWTDLWYSNSSYKFSNDHINSCMEIYAREVAQASLEKASKNASAVLIENKAGIVIPYVSKGSITNPDNIVML